MVRVCHQSVIDPATLLFGTLSHGLCHGESFLTQFIDEAQEYNAVPHRHTEYRNKSVRGRRFSVFVFRVKLWVVDCPTDRSLPRGRRIDRYDLEWQDNPCA